MDTDCTADPDMNRCASMVQTPNFNETFRENLCMPESVCQTRFEEDGFIGLVNCGEDLSVGDRVSYEALVDGDVCEDNSDCLVDAKPVCAQLFFDDAPVSQTEPF